MLTRPLTLRSKPFALLVVANVPSSVPVVRAGRDSCAWRSGHFATLELREQKMRRDQSLVVRAVEQWCCAETEACVRRRWWLRARRDKIGWQAHHVLHSRRPQECSARRTAELPRNRAAQLRACCTTPRCVGGWSTCVSKGVDGESTMRRSRWSTFPGQGSPRSAICSSKRANRCCRARGSPGVGRRSVMATRFARVAIHTNFKLGLSL